MRVRRTSLLAGVVFAALASGLVPMASHSGLAGFRPQEAQAQNLGQRVVSGSVVDANSAPLPGAVVFLRNLKSKTIRSYTATADGKFRFAQVNKAQDQEIWAEKDGKKSATKSISSWDARTEFECELKIK